MADTELEKLVVRITGDSTSATKALDDVQKKVDETSNKINSSTKQNSAAMSDWDAQIAQARQSLEGLNGSAEALNGPLAAQSGLMLDLGIAVGVLGAAFALASKAKDDLDAKFRGEVEKEHKIRLEAISNQYKDLAAQIRNAEETANAVRHAGPQRIGAVPGDPEANVKEIEAQIAGREKTRDDLQNAITKNETAALQLEKKIKEMKDAEYYHGETNNKFVDWATGKDRQGEMKRMQEEVDTRTKRAKADRETYEQSKADINRLEEVKRAAAENLDAMDQANHEADRRNDKQRLAEMGSQAEKAAHIEQQMNFQLIDRHNALAHEKARIDMDYERRRVEIARLETLEPDRREELQKKNQQTRDQQIKDAEQHAQEMEDKKAEAERKRLEHRGEALTKQFGTPEEQRAEKIKELNELLKAGVISEQTYQRALMGTKKEKNDLQKADAALIGSEQAYQKMIEYANRTLLDSDKKSVGSSGISLVDMGRAKRNAFDKRPKDDLTTGQFVKGNAMSDEEKAAKDAEAAAHQREEMNRILGVIAVNTGKKLTDFVVAEL